MLFRRPPLRPLVAAGVLVTALVACGGGDDGPDSEVAQLDVPETVAIGVLPAPLTDEPTLPPPPPPPTTAPPATTAPEEVATLGSPVSAHVEGDRILMIGDATLASAAPRNDGLICEALTIYGWDTEIDAEPGRGVEFPMEVLDARLDPDDGDPWDVVAFWFGNEVDGSDQDEVDAFDEQLRAVLERVAPLPTVLYTLTETDDGRAAINDVIRARQQDHPNVLVIDWASLGGDTDVIVADDGVALADDGQKRVSVITAAALGKAPADPEGECLAPAFADDE